MHHFPDLFSVVEEWHWPGTHYARTAEDWLQNFDAQRAAIRSVLGPVYGREVRVWERRWRLFFLATAGLFGHAGGAEWGCHALPAGAGSALIGGRATPDRTAPAGRG